MDINEQIALALARNEVEWAEILLDCTDEPDMGLIVNYTDYVRPERAEMGILLA